MKNKEERFERVVEKSKDYEDIKFMIFLILIALFLFFIIVIYPSSVTFITGTGIVVFSLFFVLMIIVLIRSRNVYYRRVK